MAAALPEFRQASELGPSPSREQELEALCSRQAEQIEKIESLLERPNLPIKSLAETITPEEKSSLLSDLEIQCKTQSKDIERLKKECDELRKALEEAQQDISWIQESFPPQIAESKRRLRALEEQSIKPQKKQIRNSEILLALLAANDGKMMAIDARHKLGISKAAFSLLLRTLADKIELKHFHLDRRKNVIVLK